MQPNPVFSDGSEVRRRLSSRLGSVVCGIAPGAGSGPAGGRRMSGGARVAVRGMLGAAGLLMAGWVQQAMGCELCAIYTGEHGLGEAKRGWFLGAAEQFTSFGSIQLNGREVPNTAGQSIENSTTQFILGYNFNDQFSLQANVPYIHRSFRRPNGTGIESGTEDGLGDAILLGKLLLLRKDTAKSSFAWSLLGGLKFPTGDTAQLLDETRSLSRLVSSGGSTHGATHSGTVNGVTTISAIHGYDLTLGSGSVDARLGTSVYYRSGRAYFSGSVQYAICTEGDYGYRFANDLTWDGALGYDVLSKPNYKLSLEAAFSGEHRGSDTYGDQPVDSTGYTVMYLGPKLNYAWKDRLTAHFGVDFPVSISNSGLQAVPGPRVRAGVTWLFGPDGSADAAAKAKPRSVAMDGSAPPIWTPAPDTHFYGGLEYLLWWVKDAPLSVPLVSSGPVSTTHHGLLGVPAIAASDSTVLYGAPHYPAQGGSDSQRFQGFSGMRLKLGYSFGAEHKYGVEASGFALQSQSAGYQAAGDSTGNPILGVPVYNTVTYNVGNLSIRPGEDSLPFSLPDQPGRFRSSGALTGSVNIVNDLELWGTELVGTVSLYRKPSFELSGLVGVRYLSLSESLMMTTSIQGVSGPFTNQSGAAIDGFRTQNQFFGGLVGLRGAYSSGRMSAELSARVALGNSHQVQNIAGGFYSVNFPPPSSSGTEGIFAQPANEGTTSTDRFSVVPDVQLKIAYAITPRLRATVGYDFLYYSSVQRPGDQINRNVPKGQTFNQADPTVSTTSPSRITKTTDFFAHGFSFGMEFRF